MSGSGTSGWGTGAFSSGGGGSVGNVGSSTSREEREALAARRLAALGLNNVNKNNSDYIAGASAPPVHSSQELFDKNLRSLVEMGFPREDARVALRATSNSLDDAIVQLSSGR